MAKKSSDYWKKRFEALEDSQYQQGQEYYYQVQKDYQQATNAIESDISRWYVRLAENNNISYQEARKLLDAKELKEFKWTVEEYIKVGEENAIDLRWMKELENASAKTHIDRLEAIKMQMQQHVEVLFGNQEDGLSGHLERLYAKGYQHTAFEVAKGTGVGSNLAKLDTRKVDQILARPWAQDGANFSDRLWTNKQKLVNNLHTELTQNVIRGTSPRQAIHNLSKQMNVSKSQAGRLIMTETAAISSAAQKECFKDLGVEQYEILATLDSLTSKICQELDGKVFDMKDYEVGTTAPPFHPNCRSTTVPHFDDEFTEGEMRAARDPETGKMDYVPANMKYGEWKQTYIKDEVMRESSEESNNSKRDQSEIERAANELKDEIENYTNRKSKWSGNVIVNNKRAEEGFRGMKSWSCNIIVSDDVTDDTLIHELLHSTSSSYCSVKDVIRNRSIEEGSVELLTKSLSKEKGLKYIPAYSDEVAVLENLNTGLQLFDDEMSFAKALFEVPMLDRYNWLSDTVENAIMVKDIPAKDGDDIRRFLEFLKPIEE